MVPAAIIILAVAVVAVVDRMSLSRRLRDLERRVSTVEDTVTLHR